jgi:ligand-binding SRPBCC domain-containing protein
LDLKVKTFEHRSLIRTTPAAARAFHDDPRALARLTPPPLFVQIVRDDRVSLTEGEVEFKLWFGPLAVRWLARHAPGPDDTSFVDRMAKGPMAMWEHLHSFRAVKGGVELVDRIQLAHYSGWRGTLTRLMMDGLPLRLLFAYRHWRTRRALARV